MIVVIGLLALIAAAVVAREPGNACVPQNQVIYETRHLSSVNEAIQAVVQGKAGARLVVAP